jgi:DNA-binding MarR family transcriptional regulator
VIGVAVTEEDTLIRSLFQALVAVRRLPWWPGQGRRASAARVLFAVEERERQGVRTTISDLRERLRVSGPTVTQWVQELEAEGFLWKTGDPADRRQVFVALSPAGRQHVGEVRAAIERSLLGLVAYLGRDDAWRLSELLQKVARYDEGRPSCPEREGRP